MEQKSMRTMAKGKRIPIARIVLVLVLAGYFSHYGLTGPAFLYGPMENYMSTMLFFRYHKQFEIGYVSADDWGTFSDGGTMGTFYDEQGNEYDCYYLHGRFYDNYGIIQQLSEVAYGKLDEQLSEIVDMENVEYVPHFSVNRENWWSSETYFHRAVTKQFITVGVKIELTDTDREALSARTWNIYQAVKTVGFPVIVETYQDGIQIDYVKFPEFDRTKERILEEIDDMMRERETQQQELQEKNQGEDFV